MPLFFQGPFFLSSGVGAAIVINTIENINKSAPQSQSGLELFFVDSGQSFLAMAL